MSGGGGGGGIGGAIGGTLNSITPAGMMGFDFQDPTGAKGAANAAQAAANAQAQMAGQTRNQILGYSGQLEKDAMSLAEASPQELGALSRAYASAEQNLGREEKLLASIDPALMEASKQALSILRGEPSGLNQGVMAQRGLQRQQLMNSLRAQYGPGAETSSIGQKVLQGFDAESQNMSMNNLGSLMNIATTDLGARQQRGIAGLQQVGQGYGALQERKLNTRLNTGAQTLGALSGTSQQMIQSAGAPFVGDAIRAQGQQSLFNMGAQAGAAYLTGGATLGAKKAAV